MKMTTSKELEFAVCTEADLDAVMNLQETVCQALENPELFAATSRSQNAGYLCEPNMILGVFAGSRLVAYGSLVYCGTDSDNLGWDLGWPGERVRHCAAVDTIVVDPAFRGLGLQRTLVQKLIEQAQQQSETYLLTTVSPQNSHSLSNMQAAGFKILMKTEKYGGRERFILGRPAVNHSGYS